MCELLFIITLFIQLVNGNFIFEDFKIEINENKHNADIMLLDNYNYGNTIEPTIEPSLYPSIIPTNYPSIIPTYINSDITNKILEFDVKINFSNLTKNDFDDNDNNILLMSFSELTDVDKGYLSISYRHFRNRKLFINILNNNYYDFDKTIMFTIPLINKYKNYESNPTELYNSLESLITNSIDSGVFLNNLKDISLEYNSTTFLNIQLELVDISEPTIIVIKNKNNDGEKISDRNLAFIIIFSIIGTIAIISILAYKFKNFRIHVLNIKENDIKMRENDILTILHDAKYSEESRIVEIINEEKI